MLDGFLEVHTQIVFKDRTQGCLSEEAFHAARSAAARHLDQPDRSFLRENGSHDRHRLFYEYHLARGMDAYSNLSSQIDRTLVEVVTLHSFLLMEEMNERSNTPSVKRSISALGWMIQERLRYIFLQTGNNSLRQLIEMRMEYGIRKDSWETRIVGASAEAKAMMQLSCLNGLRLYPATLFEDVVLGIDFFVQTLEGAGACISVKTDVGGKTRFLLESETDYEEAWTRIAQGTTRFREYTQRCWRPVLVLMGKPKGGNINLAQEGHITGWHKTLKRILTKEPVSDALVLTT